jgi:TolB-like protein
LKELQRRNVFRVAAAYVVTAWLLIEVAATLEETLRLPEWSDTLLAFFLILGFPLALFFAWAFELTPEGIKRDEDVEHGASSRSATAGRLNWIIMLVMGLALAYFAADRLWFSGEKTPGERPAETAAPPPATDEAAAPGGAPAPDSGSPVAANTGLSIVVLPFVNMSSDTEQEYFSDGMTEELLNLLARIPELKVISRSTAFAFKNKENVIPEVAARLDVTHVLEGSVRKSGSTVRITAQLIEGATDRHLWSETYDRELEDVFAVQDEISAHVVEELKLRLLGDAPANTPVDPAAYEGYLQARHIVSNRDWARLEEAEQRLEAALDIAPDYVPALYLLALVTHWLGGDDASFPYTVEESEARISGFVARMAAIDPESSYLNGLLAAFALDKDIDLPAAAGYLERAIATDPYEPGSVLRTSIRLLTFLQRYEEAEAVARYILDRDPACLPCMTQLVNVLRDVGRHREAAELLESALEWNDADFYMNWQLGVAWLVAEDPERALTYFEAIDPEMLPGNRLLGRTLALHDLGRTAEFEALLAEMQERAAANPEGLARVYAWTGQADLAMEWLERWVVSQKPGSVTTVKTDLYAKLADDPRYLAFLERHGASDTDVSTVEFNPQWPRELAAWFERPAESL